MSEQQQVRVYKYWTKDELEWLVQFSKRRPGQTNKSSNWLKVSVLFTEKFGYARKLASLRSCAKRLRTSLQIVVEQDKFWTPEEELWLEAFCNKEVLMACGEIDGWPAAVKAFEAEFGHVRTVEALKRHSIRMKVQDRPLM